MLLAKILSTTDPSRYVVYQMLDYIKSGEGFKLTQKNINGLFLSKTEPSIDSLYNHAHILGQDFSANDWRVICNFFGESPFRIKMSNNQVAESLLLAQGLALKNISIAMVLPDLNSGDFDYILPPEVKLQRVDNFQKLAQIKLIFAEAFNCSVADYDRKFGFLDQIILDDDNKHAGAFIVYVNDQPVSTGAYYAFTKFSLENIGTIKSARGQGYAGLIVKALLQEAKRLHYEEACLVSLEPGVPVYHKLGFLDLSKYSTYIKL